MNWPWTTWKSILKELKKQSDKSHENPESMVRYKSVEDLFDDLKSKSYKPSIFTRFKWWLNDFTWDVYRYFKPCHQEIRKSIPNRWTDITELIRIVNFEFLKSYHDHEMHNIEWNSDEYHRNFRDWINQAYVYITVERPKLEDDLSNAYPSFGSKGTYEEKYGEVNRLEALIEQKDTEILVDIVKKRAWFWS